MSTIFYEQTLLNNRKHDLAEVLAQNMRMPHKFAETVARYPEKAINAFQSVIEGYIFDGKKDDAGYCKRQV